MSKASDLVTPDRLKEIRERAESVTPCCGRESCMTRQFIEHAREDIPYLLERIESEREAAERETLDKAAKAICVYCRSSKPQFFEALGGPYGLWAHMNTMPCSAAAIHELARGKGEV